MRFEGGFGAQVLATSAYFWLERNHSVVGDFSYFNMKPRVAKTSFNWGQPKLSIWPWALDEVGISQDGFQQVKEPSSNFEKLTDSDGRKLLFALRGLQHPPIRSTFELGFPSLANSSVLSRAAAGPHRPYAAVHIRRGDYLNVASWMVSDEQLVDVMATHADGLDQLIICSDSQVSKRTLRALRSVFPRIETVAGSGFSALETFLLLRSATVMVGSNSQFSLVAGIFSKGVAHLPRRFVSRFEGELPGNIELF